jgi:hypothetical protein
VADERTANDAFASPCESFANASRTACSNSGGNGVSTIHERISVPAWASARTSSVFSFDKRSAIRLSRPPCFRNTRNACEVVAKPPGTRTPDALNWLIISPRLAFLPPTASTSFILNCSNGATRAVANEGWDMVEKLRWQ